MKRLIFLLSFGFSSVVISSISLGQISYSSSCTNSGSYANALGTLCNSNYYTTVAMGYNSDANSAHATAMGINCFANGTYSVALGDYNYANGVRSFVCNHRNSANGECSFASGFRTIASADYSFVLGQYNLGLSNSVFEIGWGTSSVRKNLLTVRNNGSVIIGNTDVVYGLLQINTNDADETHGITMYAMGGSTARSYLRSDGGNNFNWFLTRGGIDDKGILITPDGLVGVGTSSIPSGYKFAVDGKIRAREIKVDLEAWSDDVFAEDYSPISLYELEQYISQHKHLPEIPSEIEILNNGIELGQINALLLKKIEELTLYIIMQNKKISELDKQIKEIN